MQQNKLKIDAKRHLPYLDFLRIIACFFVVVIHVVTSNLEGLFNNKINLLFCTFIDSFCHVAVPIFFMISGVLFLNKKTVDIKKLYLDKILRLIIFYFFWSLIYTIYDKKGIIINRDFIHLFIESKFHLWFISAIILIYILLPLIHKLVKNDRQNKYIKYIIIIFLIIPMFKATILNIPYVKSLSSVNTILNKVDFNHFKYLGYFVLGYYINKIDTTKYIRKNLLLILLISNLICTLVTYINSKVFVNMTEILVNNFSVFNVLNTIIVFILFKNTKLKESSFIKKLSSYTFGVYGIHLLIFYIIINFISLKNIVMYVIVSVLTFILSLVATFFIKKIPILNKYIV